MSWFRGRREVLSSDSQLPNQKPRAMAHPFNDSTGEVEKAEPCCFLASLSRQPVSSKFRDSSLSQKQGGKTGKEDLDVNLWPEHTGVPGFADVPPTHRCIPTPVTPPTEKELNGSCICQQMFYEAYFLVNIL